MRRIFILLSIVTYARTGWCQALAGPVADVNFSSIMRAGGGNSFKLGYDAGVFLVIPVRDPVGVRAEVLYTHKGYKQHTSLTNNGLTSDTNVTHTLSYINFPLLVNVTVAKDGFIQAGPQIGFLINDRAKGTTDVISNGTVLAQKVNQNGVYGYNTTEYSLCIGGGYVFPINLSASLRFTYGISKLYNQGDPAHNISIGIALGYYLGRGAGGGGTGGGLIHRTI